MKIGEKIRSIRELNNLSQRKFSEEIGISHAELSRIETGSRKYPCPKTLKTISEKYNVSYVELMKLSNYFDSNIELQDTVTDIDRFVFDELMKENAKLKIIIAQYKYKMSKLLEILNSNIEQ